MDFVSIVFLLLVKALSYLHFVFGANVNQGRVFILSSYLSKISIKRLFLKTFSALFFAGVFLSFAACQKQETPKNTPTATREITDDLGKTISIPQKVERAVSLAPNLTENIFAVGAGDKLVGVTTFCNYPHEAQKISKIGDTQYPNLESIIALKPQIVFVSTASQIQGFTEQMQKQNIAVFVSNPQDLEGVYKTLYQLGEIFGEKQKASELVDSLKRRVADVEARTADKTDIKTFVQISKEPLFTVGKTSFVTALINRAGSISLTADINQAYPKLSKETAIALNPEVIILSESEDNPEPNGIFKNSPAVKSGKVFKINADLISRASPRLVDGLEQIARVLHPESFDK